MIPYTPGLPPGRKTSRGGNPPGCTREFFLFGCALSIDRFLRDFRARSNQFRNWSL